MNLRKENLKSSDIDSVRSLWDAVLSQCSINWLVVLSIFDVASKNARISFVVLSSLVPLNAFSRTWRTLCEVVKHKLGWNAHCVSSKHTRRIVFVIRKIRRNAFACFDDVLVSAFLETVFSGIIWEEVEFLSSAIFFELKDMVQKWLLSAQTYVFWWG